jgi:hypothetical protein
MKWEVKWCLSHKCVDLVMKVGMVVTMSESGMIWISIDKICF